MKTDGLNIGRASTAILIAGVVLLVCLASATAAELRFIEVDRDKDHYSLRSVSWFDSDIESVYAVLTDYELFHRFTSAIVESRNLELDARGRPGYYTRMEGCVLFWCQSFVRRGHLELDPMRQIEAIADPEQSDFRIAREKWQLREEGGGTLMIYEFEMVPDFWVPPVIGPYYMKRALKSGGEKAVDRIEALAIATQATRAAQTP